MLLEGKVAVVTGGTRGIGFEIVRKYLANGAKVVLFGSRSETVDKALAKLKEENPAWEAEGMYPRLTDAAEVEKAILSVKEKFGKIDILVNNAGISQSTPLYDYTPEEFDKAIDLNVRALFYAILPTARIMKEQGGGCILNTSSMVSISGQPAGVGYPTSKFAVNGLPCKRTGQRPYPGKCRGSGRDQNRHGGSPASGGGRPDFLHHPPGKAGRARRGCQRIPFPGKRNGQLCNR